MEEITIPHKVELAVPIKWGKDENAEIISSIEFTRRLQVKDLKGFPATSLMIDHYVRLLSRLTGHPPAFIERLDGVDWLKCQEVLAYFLGGSQETGS